MWCIGTILNDLHLCAGFCNCCGFVGCERELWFDGCQECNIKPLLALNMKYNPF